MFAESLMAARPADHGPRLSDADLLQSLDLKFPGMEAVAKAVAKGDQKAALEALAQFFRLRKEPCDYCPKSEENTKTRSAAEEVIQHNFTVGGIPYTFPKTVDWYYNPTTAPGSNYPRDYEWQWQLNRHREFDVLAHAYRDTGDEKYAQAFARLLESWIRDCPVPEKGAWNAPARLGGRSKAASARRTPGRSRLRPFGRRLRSATACCWIGSSCGSNMEVISSGIPRTAIGLRWK